MKMNIEVTNILEFEVSPCRFCGDNERLVIEYVSLNRFQIFCQRCEAAGPTANNRELAVQYWNCGKK